MVSLPSQMEGGPRARKVETEVKEYPFGQYRMGASWADERTGKQVRVLKVEKKGDLVVTEADVAVSGDLRPYLGQP